ncbi:MAG TPA: carboxymuconolactone decarboxylase family protein [Beijerinckiaceae bacterium]|jgi:4-carboxymuconolactone decarboxylase
MSRLPEIDPDSLSPAQKVMYEDILRVRGQVRGPFAIWLNSPDLGRLTLQTQDWFQKKSQLSDRMVELAILMVARRHGAQFAWAVHERRAQRFGLPDEAIAAIRARRRPTSLDPQEERVYDIVTELGETSTLSPASYEAATKALGVTALVELVSLTGFYVMIGLLLNTFDADAPEGSTPLEP